MAWKGDFTPISGVMGSYLWLAPLVLSQGYHLPFSLRVPTEWPTPSLRNDQGSCLVTPWEEMPKLWCGTCSVDLSKNWDRCLSTYIAKPIRSMYGIFTYIYHKNQPNVGIYIPYMDGKWWGVSKVFWRWESLPGCPAGVVIVSRSVIVSWVIYNISRRWFQIFSIFTPICGRFPFWLIFFKGLKPPTRYVRDVYTTYTYIVVKWSMY